MPAMHRANAGLHAASSSSAASSDDGWGQVTKEFLRVSQEDSDEALKCEACRSETSKTDSCTQSDSDHLAVGQPRSWWAELIRIYTKGFGSMKLATSKITVVSACAGIFAEGETLKEGCLQV